MDNPLWTDSHREGLKKMVEIADKYFDSYLLCCGAMSSDTHHGTERYAYSGGKMAAIGLAQSFSHCMFNNNFSSHQDEEPDTQ